MIYRNNEIQGTITAQNDVYTICDKLDLNHLILSKVILHKGQKTRGHIHKGQEEIYFFLYGSGIMIVGDLEFTVGMGDVIIVPDGEFHKVENTGYSDLIFNTVYNKVDKPSTVYAT